ncbi:MAG: putative signal transduction protein with EAL and GGDEF domain [Oleiphilaceae bacterium]|jgi:predicted signal transduction protein with EAL and GGDEF domain
MTLNFRIFKLIGGLVTASSLAILVTVWLTGISQISSQVSKDLDVGQSVIERVFDNRSSLLFSTADVLTADFGFKQAVASRDQYTIESALKNHGERISADLMVLLSLEGETLASTFSQLAVGTTFTDKKLVDNAVEDGGVISMLSLGGKLYQIILLIVEAPNPLAIAVVGFEINNKLINDLKNITKLHVTIYSSSQENNGTYISSLSEEYVDKAILAEVDTSEGLNPFTYNSEQFVSQHFPMKGITVAQGYVDVILSERISYWFSSFYQLLIDIVLIGILSMVLAILLGLIFSHNITKPLANLVLFAKHIASGEYRKKEDADQGTKTQEISRLEEAFFTMQEDIRNREETIEYHAKYDLVTKLFNRYEITDLIKKRLAAKDVFEVISFKVVGFREVNNAFGYDSGDACLESLGARIQLLDGSAARLGGSEILWVPVKQLVRSDLDNIRDELEEPHILKGLEIRLKLAIGHLVLPKDASTVEYLFRNLSIAVQKAEDDPTLYQCYQEGMEQEYLKRLAILRELEIALEQGNQEGSNDACELDMFYQPKLHLATNQVTKVEALIRWNSKVLGFVPPDLFIPIAEKAGLINELTQWVITRVVGDLARWRELGVHICAAVNLSVHDLTYAPLIEHIQTLLDENNIGTDLIEFEVTESDLMNDPKKAILQLDALKAMGFALAMDDFGTGYSSMSYLKNMPVTTLKIDKSFVLNLHENIDDQTIVQVIIDLAKRFDLELVAEGVENEAALQMLKTWGCDYIQGYHISKPVDGNTLLKFLAGYKDNAEKLFDA